MGDSATTVVAPIPAARSVTGSRWRIRAIALAFVMVVAVLFRTAGLGTVPAGLNPDEALNGNESIEAHQIGKYPIFYPSNNGREGMFIDLIGVSESIVGPGLLGVRLPAAIIGSLTILFVFLFGKELLGWRAAIFGSFLLATSFWHVALSRTGFRAILVPLLLTSSLFLLLRALREDAAWGTAGDRLWMALAGGLLYGLGFHSYIAFRITPVIALAYAGVELRRRWKHHENLRQWAAVVGVWWGAAVFVALPMALYFAGHPEDFVHRMNQLSPLRRQHPLLSIWYGISMAALQFNVRGDSDWGTNMSSAPLLIWPVGVLFLLGVGMAVWVIVRRRKNGGDAALLLVWLVTMLAPTALSHDTSAMRSIGCVTPVFLLAGWAAAWIYMQLVRRAGPRKAWACGVFVAAVLACGVVEGYRYFGVWAHSDGMAGDLYGPAVREGWMLNTFPTTMPRYVSMEPTDQDLLMPFMGASGAERPMPYGAGIVVLETRQNRTPAFLYDNEATRTHFPAGSVVVQMYPTPDFFAKLQAAGVRLHTGERDGVPFAVIE